MESMDKQRRETGERAKKSQFKPEPLLANHINAYPYRLFDAYSATNPRSLLPIVQTTMCGMDEKSVMTKTQPNIVVTQKNKSKNKRQKPSKKHNPLLLLSFHISLSPSLSFILSALLVGRVVGGWLCWS